MLRATALGTALLITGCAPQGTPVEGEQQGRPLYVMVKENGKWLIATGQNTPFVEPEK